MSNSTLRKEYLNMIPEPGSSSAIVCFWEVEHDFTQPKPNKNIVLMLRSLHDISTIKV